MIAEPLVHIIDDEIALAEVLAKVLHDVGLKAKTHKNALEFLATYQAGTPGCIVTDLRMPGMSGTALVERLRAQQDPIPIIVVSAYADVAMAVNLMKAGVRDVIEKGGSTQALLEVIQRAVLDDRQSRTAAEARLEWQARLATLTSREMDVLIAVVAGKTNREVAAELGISANTVEIHRSRVMEKMRVESLADLIKASIVAGIETPFPKAV